MVVGHGGGIAHHVDRRGGKDLTPAHGVNLK